VPLRIGCSSPRRSHPRRDGLHGGARAIAHFLHRLAARHEIALVYLRASDKPSLDAQLAPELAHAEEIA
jgi:hypothetical protein